MSQQLISIFVQGGLNSAQNSAQFLPFSDPVAAGAVVTFMLDIGRDLIIRGAETIICLLGMTRYDILIFNTMIFSLILYLVALKCTCLALN